MIKQLLSSAGNNKEAGLATNITKSGNGEGNKSPQGLFDSILKTVQGFGQQEGSEQASSKKEEDQPEETAMTVGSSVQNPASQEQKNDTVAGTVEAGQENAEVSKTETEKSKAEAQKSSELSSEANAVNNEISSKETEGVLPSAVAADKMKQQEETNEVSEHSATGKLAGEKTSESQDGQKESGQNINTTSEHESPDVVSKKVNQEPAAESIENKTSYEVRSAKSGSILSDSENSESINSGTGEAKRSVQATAEMKDAEAEAKIELQQETENVRSASENINNAGSTIAGEVNASQQTNQKIIDQISQKVTQNKQSIVENSEVKNTDNETSESAAGNAVRIATEQSAEGAPEIVQGIQTQKAEEVREKRFRENYSFSGRHELNSERLDVITQSRESKTPFSFLSQFEAPVHVVQQQASQSSGSTMTTEQEMMLKEHLKESVEVTEQKDTANAAFARLGEVPISNMLVRRTIMPSLTQAVQKTISAGKASPETWQKHSFELEDGNSIQLSTRQVDGVLQVKLATTSVELSRLMQQYEQEIKQHLEQECQLDVNLQFDGGEQGQEMAGFFGDTSSSGKKAPLRNLGIGSEQTATQNTEKNLQQSVRRFGYNQMEWTA